MEPVQSNLRRNPIRRAIFLDTDIGSSVSPWHRWAWAFDVGALGDCCSNGHAGIVENPGARADLFCPGAVFTSRAIRNLYCFELFPLVHFLGIEPHPSIPADKTLGRPVA